MLDSNISWYGVSVGGSMKAPPCVDVEGGGMHGPGCTAWGNLSL